MRKIFFSMIALMMSVVMNAATFTITDNGDGTATVTPDPASASWIAYAYPEGGKADFLMMFGLDESRSDADVLNSLLTMYAPVVRGCGEGDFDIADYMENFGGANDGNYVIAIAELNEEGAVVGEAATQTIAFVTSEEKEIITLDVVDSEVSDKEVWNIYDNEKYKLYLDITKNLPLEEGKEYTINDLDLGYSYIKSKDEIVTNQFGTHEWKKYEFTDIKFVMNPDNTVKGEFTAQNGDDTISAEFIYSLTSTIGIELTGECEYLAELDLYSFSAKNKGSEVKDDYSFSLGIKGSAWSTGMFVTSDLYTRGNYIKVAAGEEKKITAADLMLFPLGDGQLLMGEVTAADGQVYSIMIITNIPSAGDESVEVDLGSVLEISEDEGDIKLKAVTPEHEFVGYITCPTTDVPAGTYDLLSYSKYGDYDAEWGMYMSDRFSEGKVTVANNAGVISITATFKQNGKGYTVKASNGTTGISTTTATAAIVRKYLDNGRLVILKGGKKYGVDAVEVK